MRAEGHTCHDELKARDVPEALRSLPKQYEQLWKVGITIPVLQMRKLRCSNGYISFISCEVTELVFGNPHLSSLTALGNNKGQPGIEKMACILQPDRLRFEPQSNHLL